MRSYPPATAAAFGSRGGLVVRVLVWIVARNRTTGAQEAAGFWNGEEDRGFTIDGAQRVYTGAGGLLSVDPIVMRAGLSVQMQRLSLSGVSEAVEDVVRGYDVRLAPIEIHRALYHPETGALIDAPHRVFKGTVDEIELRTPEAGGTATVTVSAASSLRALTRGLALKKSHESQQLRQGDQFRRYADVSGRVTVWWGEEQHDPDRPAPPPPPQLMGRPPGDER